MNKEAVITSKVKNEVEIKAYYPPELLKNLIISDLKKRTGTDVVDESLLTIKFRWEKVTSGSMNDYVGESAHVEIIRDLGVVMEKPE